MSEFAEYRQALTEKIAQHPTLLNTSEFQKVIVVWNQTATVYNWQCVHHYFEQQAQLTPHAPAVVMGQEQLTYAQLNLRAHQLACFLQQCGVGPDTLVGLCMERSIDMIIGLLGILKAGGAYVPLDPGYPAERLAFMLHDSQASVLLTYDHLAKRFPHTQAQVICLDTQQQRIFHTSSPSLSLVPTTLENLAYVIYTSGSTGQPKGIAMCHYALANLIHWQRSISGTTPQRTLQFTTLSFDVAFQELFTTWCSGGTVVLISEQQRQDIINLPQLLEQQAIERLFLPFVALQQLAEACRVHQCFPSYLQEITTAGEQLQVTPALRNMFQEMKGAILYNQYGPTESHVVTAFRLPAECARWPMLPPIGRPIANTSIYLLDESLSPVPVGVEGQLYIGGIALARGYLHRPALTAERFLPDPFSKNAGSCMYATGDRARFLPDGTIECLGRIDQQVKISGFRIEPGEIEIVLNDHPAVSQAIVVIREYTPDDKRLVAYIVLEQPEHGSNEVFDAQFRHYLEQRLPHYMIPSNFVSLTQMPLTPSGKVDKKSLPAPLSPVTSGPAVAPRTRRERKVAAIWSEILHREEMSIHDDFFEHGGNSLLAVRVVTAIQQRFKISLTLKQFFDAPTIAQFTKLIEHTMLANAKSEEIELLLQKQGGNIS